MSLQVVPNSGIFNDETLDRLRGDAIVACQEGLPEELVYYLRALEERFLGLRAEQKVKAIREIGWKHLPSPESDAP